jgi:hypothetical protein
MSIAIFKSSDNNYDTNFLEYRKLSRENIGI